MMVIAVYFVVLGIFSPAEAQNSSVRDNPFRRHRNIEEENCPSWNETFPYSNGVDSKCWFSVSESTKKKFLHEVLKHSYSLVNFELRFENTSSKTKEEKCVIQGNKWTWTFPGPKGSRQYLNWPLEYRVWSLGLLNFYTLDGFDLPIQVHGNCPVRYGASETTQRISLALANLTDYLVTNHKGGNENSLKEYYNQSYWCYRQRIYIKSRSLYMLCLNVICPLEAIGYRCCRWKWDYLNQTRALVCSGKSIKFGEVGWILPFLLGVVLYMFFPLILIWLFGHIHELTFNHSSYYLEMPDFDINQQNDVHVREIAQENEKPQNWIFYNPIHIGTIITSVFRCCCVKCPFGTSRFIRIIFLFVSISVLSLKLLLHGILQYDDILASVHKGVPKDFESIIAGYSESRKNFLRVFGGPYVACFFYAVCFILSTCLPSDLASFLAKGLVKEDTEIKTLLIVPTSVLVKFGALKTRKNYNGYREIFRTMLAEFFMILSPSFWKFAVVRQSRRWTDFIRKSWRRSPVFSRLLVPFLTPFYILLCILELALCMLRYGVPLVCFLKIVIRAYVIAPWRDLELSVPFKIIYCIFASLFALFSMYMFSIIFVDSFIFICGVFVYTYTGLFAHPEMTYGYLIFSFTVLLYMFDSFNNISKVYDELFWHTRKICKKLHKHGKYPGTKLYKREEECKGIPRDLFFLVVQKYLPIRHQVFLSFVKLIVIIIVIYISVDLLYEFSASKNLHILTQAAATIIVCLVPKFIGDSCSLFKHRRHSNQSHQVKYIIQAYYQRSKEGGFVESISNLEVL